MLIVTLVIATLMASVRQQTRVAGARERRTALLYAMSRELAATRGSDEHGARRRQARRRSVRLRGVVLLPDATGRLHYPARSADGRVVSRRGPVDRAMGRRSWPARRAWARIRCRPRRRCICRSATGVAASGVLAVLPRNRRRVLLPEQRHLLETFAGQLGLALERARLAEHGGGARVAAETREPAQHAARLDLARPAHAARGDRRRAQHARRSAARRSTKRRASSSRARSRPKARDMSELVSNVLDLMRFESGQLALRRDWETLDDLVGAALERNEERLAAIIRVEIAAAGRSAARVRRRDARRAGVREPVRQRREVHAARHASIVVHGARRGARGARDRRRRWAGPAAAAIRSGCSTSFSAASEEGTIVGAGLGLAICRAIVRAHGGRDRGRSDRPGGGARFEFTLPTQEAGRMTQAMHQILVVEDDDVIRDVLRVLLAGGELSRRRGDDGAPADDRSAQSTSPICCSSISACPTATGSTSSSACARGRPCRSSCCRRGRWRRRRSQRSTPAPTTTSRNRSARRSCSRACARALRRNVRGTERIATLRIGATDVDLEHRTATNGGRREFT